VTDTSKVVIVGQMGTGKTTVGRLVASLLGRPYRDNDVVLEARTGRTAAEIAGAAGADALHALERQVFDDLLDEEGATVVAAPASVAGLVDADELHERAFVIWLRASPEVLARRASTSTHRPLPAHARRRYFAELAAERDAFFDRTAHLTIDTGRAGPTEAADLAARAIRAHPPGGPGGPGGSGSSSQSGA